MQVILGLLQGFGVGLGRSSIVDKLRDLRTHGIIFFFKSPDLRVIFRPNSPDRVATINSPFWSDLSLS